jgi:hypothetical protein
MGQVDAAFITYDAANKDTVNINADAVTED